MIRAWLGIAILAASWLPGLGYYEPANPLLWLAMVILGTAAWMPRTYGCRDGR